VSKVVEVAKKFED